MLGVLLADARQLHVEANIGRALHQCATRWNRAATRSAGRLASSPGCRPQGS
jgi:hypothetical protein